MIQQLDPQDAQFLYLQTSNNLSNVMMVTVHDPSTAPSGKVGFNDIVQHIRSRLNSSPIFTRRLYRLPMDIDHAYWVTDEHFDLDAHFSQGSLNAPGDRQQLNEQISRHFSSPLDMNRPLWDMHILFGLDNVEGFAPGSFAIFTRIHHAAIDGVSMMRFFEAIGDMDAAGSPLVDVPSEPPEHIVAPSTNEVLNRLVRQNLSSPLKMSDAFLRHLPALLGGKKKTDPSDSGDDNSADKSKPQSSKNKIPKTRFNVPLSPHKIFDFAEFSLGDIKKIRTLVDGATVNDAVLAIVSDAVRCYLIKNEELPDESLYAISPINARTDDTDTGSPGNNITAMTIKLSTDIKSPEERFQAIHETSQSAKAGESGLGSRILLDVIQHVPAPQMAATVGIIASERFAPTMTNVYVSNVRGSQNPIYMAGSRITHQFGLAPIGNHMGLFVATPSYNGKISFCIISDRSIMPDIEIFNDCLKASFDEYLKLATRAGKKGT